MLSTQTIKNAESAQHYFLGTDNYYKENDSLAQERSAWWGRGAQALGLAGTVDTQRFTQLLQGILPSGQQLGKRTEQKIEHRPGFDLTLSVPKSVSLAALLGNDTRILNAIDRAANVTLSMIERNCAQARVTTANVTDYQNTRNLVVAKFLHDVSREADPQLHMHCVVMNMTQRLDGEWRSLASQSGQYGAHVTKEVNGFIEQVRHHKLHYGTVFRAELAYELKQLGYSILKTGQHNFFEVDGFEPALLTLFSKRRQQIETQLTADGLASAKAAAVATLKTRPSKGQFNREALEERWRLKGETIQVDPFALAQAVVERTKSTEVPQEPLSLQTQAQVAVFTAAAFLAETQVVLKETHLLNHALQFSEDPALPMDALVNAVQHWLKTGELIQLTAPSRQRYFTTRTLVQAEQALLKAATVSTPQPLVAAKAVQHYLKQQPLLADDQRLALKTTFASTCQINLIEGAAGTGKTTLIGPLLQIARANGLTATVLTPSQAESHALQAQLAQRNPLLKPSRLMFRQWISKRVADDRFATVAGYLHREMAQESTKPTVPSLLIIDNAHQIGAQAFQSLVQLAQQRQQTLIALGDKRALLGFGAGTPFTQLLEHGAAVATVTHVQRQQAKALKAALALSVEHNVQAALKQVGNRIIPIKERDACLRAMAAHYANQRSPEREATRLLMPSMAQCVDLNAEVHTALQAAGVVSQTTTSLRTLVPLVLSSQQAGFAQFYRDAQWLRFNQAFPAVEIEKGDYLKLISVQRARNILELEKSTGERLMWPLSAARGRALETFKEVTLAVGEGEQLQCLRRDTQQGLHKGETFTVQKINEHQLTGLRTNGKTLTLNLAEVSACHVGYGYASTPSQQAHTPARHIMAYQTSQSPQSHQRLFYKTVAQAEQTLWIYTDNKPRLLQQITALSGDKNTALQTLLQSSPIDTAATFSPTSAAYLELIEASVARYLSTQEAKDASQATPEAIAKTAVAFALSHLTETEVAFEHKQLLETALRHVMGDVNIAHLNRAVKAAEQHGELIQGLYSRNGTAWTTREGVEIERAIIRLALQDQGHCSPLANTTVIENQLASRSPSQEHAHVVRALCQSTDRYCVVQGYAGTGKTTMLMHLRPILEDMRAISASQDYRLLCLAPTHVAVKELVNRGLTAQTLDSFLIEKPPEAEKNSVAKLVLAVDESSMVSNKQMVTLMQLAQTRDMRVIFIGDREQNPAINSGKPHILLQSVLPPLYLKDIQRQKEVELLTAVKQLYAKDYQGAFDTLNQRVIEIPNMPVEKSRNGSREARLEAIANDYLARTPAQRVSTLIITLGNSDRLWQNEKIREGLKSEGSLTGQEHMQSVLMSRKLSEAERAYAQFYQAGDRVRFNFSNKRLGIEKDTYLTVQTRDVKNNTLILENTAGQTIAWQPVVSQKTQRVGVEVYEKSKRVVMAGDLIRWTRTDKKLGLLSPEMARVVEVSETQIALEKLASTRQGLAPTGEKLALDATQAKFQHWDHAYAMTGYSSQGKTVKNVLVNLESYRTNLTHQAAALVTLSRAEYQLTVYTDNKEKLLEQIENNTGQKRSALELIGEWKDQPETLEKASKEPIVTSTDQLKDKTINELNLANNNEKYVPKNHTLSIGNSDQISLQNYKINLQQESVKLDQILQHNHPSLSNIKSTQFSIEKLLTSDKAWFKVSAQLNLNSAAIDYKDNLTKLDSTELNKLVKQTGINSSELAKSSLKTLDITSSYLKESLLKNKPKVKDFEPDL